MYKNTHICLISKPHKSVTIHPDLALRHLGTMTTLAASLILSPFTLPTHSGDRKAWSNLIGAGVGLAIAEAAQTWSGVVLLVTADKRRV